MEVLNNICLNITDCEHKTAPIQEKGISSIRTTDIKNGVIDFKGSNKVSEETYTNWTQRVEPQPYDLVLAREAPVGQVGMIPKGYRACLGQRTVLIRPNQQKVYPVYLLYLLLSKEIQHEMKIRASGSTVEHLNMLDIRNLKLPNLPSLKVQQEIGDTLGNLDAKIDNLRRQNETLEEIARSIFKHWFIDFEFPNADGKPYKSSGGAMVRSDLGDIPEGWQVGKLGEYLEIQHGFNFTSDDFVDDGHTVVRMGNFLTGGGLDFNKDKTKYFQGKINDKFLLNKGALVVVLSDVTQNGLILGNPGIIPSDGIIYLLNQRVGRINIKKHLNTIFLYYLMTTKPYKHWVKNSANSTTVLNTSPSRIYDFLFKIPSDSKLSEQFQEYSHSLVSKKEVNILQIQTLTKTRDALSPKLMSGQLRVKE